MKTPFTITFPNQVASVIQVQSFPELPAALKSLNLAPASRRVLVVIGGASKLDAADYQSLRHLFERVLAPIAQKWQACVVDGGTDAGVMQLMGSARTAIQGTFPLVGVCPIGLTALPEQSPVNPDAAPLEPGHTHFLLVPGSHWGDESAWLAKTASELAGTVPSVTLLINGGEITWKDALQNIQAGRRVIVIAGSGRTADLLAAALRGEPSDDRAEQLVASGLVQAVHLNEATGTLADILETIFEGA